MRQHPADAEGTDCHGPYGPRNDSVFVTACVYLDAKPYRYVIARERSDRGNPFPLILHFAFCILHFVRQHDKSQFRLSHSGGNEDAEVLPVNLVELA